VALKPGSDYTISHKFWHDPFEVGCRV